MSDSKAMSGSKAAMSAPKTAPSGSHSRRAFFARSGVALGTGLVSAGVGATVLDDSRARLDALYQQLGALEDREALRHLHQAYLSLVENRQWQALPGLFSEEAEIQLHGETWRGGQDGLRSLYVERYAQQALDDMHTAFSFDQRQQQDHVELDAGRQQASACFHCRVQLSTPLRDDSVAARMARLQGMDTVQRWEQGRFTVTYLQEGGQWRIHRLSYRAA